MSMTELSIRVKDLPTKLGSASTFTLIMNVFILKIIPLYGIINKRRVIWVLK